MKRSAGQSDHQLTLYEHAKELLFRLAISGVFLAISSFIIYFFYDPILRVLSSPLKTPLYYSNPAGGFSFVMKVCFTCGLILSIPVLIYNIIMFIRPAFKKKFDLKYVINIIILSTLLAITGTLFAFIFILPGTLEFFKGFDGSGLNALISADSYLDFLTSLVLMFVVVFQIPLVILIIDRIKPIPPKKLLKYEGPVIYVCIFASLFAPFTYDLFTNIIFAGPMILLYNLSILAVAISHWRKRKKHARPKENTLKDTMPYEQAPITQLVLPVKKSTNLAREPKAMDIKTNGKKIPSHRLDQNISVKTPRLPKTTPQAGKMFFDIVPATKTNRV